MIALTRSVAISALLVWLWALGAQAQTIHTQGFNSSISPWYETTYDNDDVPDVDWSVVGSGTNPTCSPHEGDGMARFNSYYADTGDESRIRSPTLDLTGAEVAEFFPAYMVPARAAENHLWLIAVNRVGQEGGYSFIGRSRIAGPIGLILADGKAYEEDVLYAELNPALARDKHLVVDPGNYEVHPFDDRRPEFYAPLVQLLPQPDIDSPRSDCEPVPGEA